MNLRRIVSTYPETFFKLNIALKREGLPFYWKGGFDFNPEYRPFPLPRWVFIWRPPFFKLDEVYLSYKPEYKDQKDIVYKVDSDTIRITQI